MIAQFRLLLLLLIACGGRTIANSIDAATEASIADAPKDLGAPDVPPATCPAQPTCGCIPGSCQFDRGASAASVHAIDVNVCAEPNGPKGPGHVTITFDCNGSVETAAIDKAPYSGTTTGDCLSALFATAKIPTFCGGLVTVGRSFSVQ